MPEIDENSVLDDEQNLYSNDVDNASMNTETGTIKNGSHDSKKRSGEKKI